MASPRSSFGIGMTAIAEAPDASSARRCEKRLAAASTRSPAGERLRAFAAEGTFAPNASRASPGLRVACVQPQRRLWRVVRREHAGRERRFVRCRLGNDERMPKYALDGVARHAAGAEQCGHAEARHDGGLNADARRPAIHDQIDPSFEIGQHMLRGGRRHVAGLIGGRRDHRLAERFQDVERHRVIGHAHRDAVEAGGGQFGNRTAISLRQHQGQRPRPEHAGEQFGIRI